MSMFADQQVNWFLADGTDVFWHPPKTGVFGGKTADDLLSFFATPATLAGKPAPGAQVWLQLGEGPNAGMLPVLAIVYANDETTVIARKLLGTNAGLSPVFGPISVPSGTYNGTPANNTVGFCVKLYDNTAGAALTVATYTCMVWWIPTSTMTAR